MRKILSLFIVTFILLSFTSSKSKHKRFVGNWIWKNNNQTFKVHIYSQYNMLKGDYSLTETIDSTDVVIYQSNRIIDPYFNIEFGSAIAGSSSNGKKFNGIIKDNVLLGDGIHGVKEGALSILLISKTKAKWEVKQLETFNKKRNREPKTFSIPTNIVLTKVEN